MKRRVLDLLVTMSIRTRLFILMLVILIGSFSYMGYQQAANITTVIEKDAIEKAQSDLLTGMAILDAKYPGDWIQQDDQLYKGETLINDNVEVIDLIQELTNGDTATLFLGDTRITTNVIVNGQRAVGTQASSAVVEKVLNKGETYLGQADVVGNTYQAAYMPLRDASGQVIGMWYVGAPDADERIQQVKQDLVIKLVAEAAVVLVIAFLLFFVLTRPMIRRIQDSAHFVQVVASGDLTLEEQRVNSKDETGILLQSVNQMSKDLRAVISKVKDASLRVASSSEQLAASTEQTSQATSQINLSIQEVAEGAAEQLNSITHSTEAVLEITRGMDQVAEAIQNMADFSATVSGNANQGAQVVNQSIEHMNLVKRTVEDASQIIHNLEVKSKQIDEIVVAITAIAEQTHLLALNASIEAAHAGEQGKGFAVVAAEVKKLAEQSGHSAEKVSELIEQIQADSYQAVLAMNQGTKVVEQGVDQVRQTGITFRDIANSIVEISSQSQEVSAVVEQVHANSHETVSRMERMTEILQQASDNTNSIAAALEQQHAATEEVSSSVAHLSETADGLHLLVKTFKV